MGRTKPLAADPGWNYGSPAAETGTLAQFRRDLWDYYRLHRIEQPVTLRWYEGLRVRAFLGNDLSLCLFVGGSYEPNEFVFLDIVLQPGMTFIDGGANEGLYSLFAAKHVGASGRVLAIEPSRRELSRLHANLSLNHLDVTPLQVALGRDCGTASLAIAERGHEGQNTIGSTVSDPNVVTVTRESVAVTTLDRIVDEQRLERVDVVKLDVEGSEVDALLGATRVVDRFRPLFLLEVEDGRLSSQGHTKDDLRGVLALFDYELFVFDERSGDLRRAVAPSEPEGNAVAAPRQWEPPTTA